MTAKIYIFIGLFLLFFHQKTTGQEIVFDLPYAALLYNNPAYTGILGPIHTGTTFRSQFTASASPYTTYYAEADLFIEKWNSGFGFYVLNDLMAAGQFRQTAAALSYVFAFHVTENMSLRPAIQAVFHNRHRDFQTITFPDMIDITGASMSTTNLPYEPYNINSIDFSVGVLGGYRNLEVGLSVHHLGDQNEREHLRNSLKINTHIKYIIPLLSADAKKEVKPSEWLEMSQVKLIPSIRYIQQENYNYLTVGLLVQSGALFAGGGIKTALQQDITSINLSAGFMSSTFRIGYAADFIGWGGVLGGWQGVSHEVFVHFIFGENSDTVKRKNKKYKSSCFGCYL
jgi:type IX secretion system PorP/SprF family membrane protein